jgi:hypothetical protein
MKSGIQKITIIPAKFAKNEGSNHCIIECLVGDDKDGNPIVQERKFEKEMIEHISNPTYLFIGLIHGPGFIQSNFVDAKDFVNLFEEKWSILVL